MDNLDKKLKEFFPTLIVNKKYAITSEVKRLPRFISEYLIMKFTKNEKLDYEGLQKSLNNYYVHPEERNKVLFELRKEGKKEIMDEFYVEMRVISESAKTSKIKIASDIIPGLVIPTLRINNAWIRENILIENPDLLRGGMWGIGKIEISRKVLLANVSLVGLSEGMAQISVFNLIPSFKNIFKEKLKETGFEVILIDPSDPNFLFNLKEAFKKSGEKEGLIRREDLNDNLLISLAYELLINYIFKPSIIYQKEQKNTIFQIEYFSLQEKKWKIFQSKPKKIDWVSSGIEAKEEIEKFFAGNIVDFLDKEKITSSFFITLTEFKPYQVTSLTVNSIISNRKNFTTEEWKDVMIRSIGLNPDNYNGKQKLLILTRLVPLVENNVCLIELGPKATGKTYIFRNTSFYTRIFAGGKVSPAQIFYHGTYKVEGEIVRRDCIVFDELSKIYFDTEMVSKLKDYMVDGYFERLGLKRAHSECSLVFIDNIESNINMENISPNNFSKYLLPSILTDTAFLDRIHGIIPGWELPKIEQAEKHLAMNYGLTSDVLCEFFHQLRNKNFLDIVNEKVKLIGQGITIRDEKGIKKIICGLSKLLFPDYNLEEKELYEIVNLAIELRGNVNRILYALEPLEFPYKKINFKIN